MPFPPLMQGNPAADAGSFASSAAAVRNAKISAANQAAERQRLQQAAAAAAAHQGLMDELEAFRMGAIPVEGPGDAGNNPGYITKNPGAAPGTPGNVIPILKGAENHVPIKYNRPGFEQELADSEAAQARNAAAQSGTDAAAPVSDQAPASGQQEPASSSRDMNRMLQINGKWYYFKTDPEKAKDALDNTNSFEVQPDSDEEKFLQETIGYEKGSKQRIPFSHIGAISALANNLQQSADLQEKRKQTGKVTQTLHDSLLEHGVDIPVGAALPYAEIDNLVNTAKAPAKTTKALHWENTTDDKGNVHVRSYDEDGKLAKEYTYPGEGKATKQTDEVKPPSKSLLTQIENRKGQALRKAREAYRKAVTPLDARLPVDKATKQQATEDLRQELQDAQDNYEAELATATGHDIEHNDWADVMVDDTDEQAPASAQPAQAPAAATQQPTARKLTGQPVKGQGPPAEGPPADVVQKLAPGTHTFGNGQVWKKNQDGSMTFVGGGK